MENGLINLACIVGLLVFAIGTIPLVLFLGTQRSAASVGGRAAGGGQGTDSDTGSSDAARG